MQQGLGLMGRETSLLCKETGVHSSARKAHPSLSPEQKQSLKHLHGLTQVTEQSNIGKMNTKPKKREHRARKWFWLALHSLNTHRSFQKEY